MVLPTLLMLDPLSLHQQTYSFESAVSSAIPSLSDPDEYEKAGSVFASGDSAGPIKTSAKNDPRLRTVVCVHWLDGLCMKAEKCEFLHQYVLEKMPPCKSGDRCKRPNCKLRHVKEADKLECVFYKQGFCIHGPRCRYNHVRRPRDDLPEVANYTLGLSQMHSGDGGAGTVRRPAARNEFYKVSMCKHFQQGTCPYGEGCHFAHGEHELRSYADRNRNGLTEDGAVDESIFTAQGGGVGGGGVKVEAGMKDYYTGGEAGGGGRGRSWTPTTRASSSRRGGRTRTSRRAGRSTSSSRASATPGRSTPPSASLPPPPPPGRSGSSSSSPAPTTCRASPSSPAPPRTPAPTPLTPPRRSRSRSTGTGQRRCRFRRRTRTRRRCCCRRRRRTRSWGWGGTRGRR